MAIHSYISGSGVADHHEETPSGTAQDHSSDSTSGSGDGTHHEHEVDHAHAEGERK